jgi:hypothetical protein
MLEEARRELSKTASLSEAREEMSSRKRSSQKVSSQTSLPEAWGTMSKIATILSEACEEMSKTDHQRDSG